jgi:hypothetical protein
LFIFVTLFVAIAHIALCHPLPKAFGTAVAKSYASPQKQKDSHSNAPRLWLCAKNKQPKAKLHNAAL